MATATATNPVVAKLTQAITPIISIGVGSAIYNVCKELGKDPENLNPQDLPAVRNALVEYYEKFWAHKKNELKSALSKL